MVSPVVALFLILTLWPPVSARAARMMEEQAVTVEDREAAQMRSAEVTVAAGRMSEEDLGELREFNEERDTDTDGSGRVRE